MLSTLQRSGHSVGRLRVMSRMLINGLRRSFDSSETTAAIANREPAHLRALLQHGETPKIGDLIH